MMASSRPAADPSLGPLRRADWRFLLPRPPGGQFARLVLLGGPAGLATRLEQLRLADQVSQEVSITQSTDALIVLHDTPTPLGSAIRCLAPGGVLYAEVDRRTRAGAAVTPQRVRRSLERAGLTVTGTFWAKPDFPLCEMYLPLEAPTALQWYMSTLYTSITASRFALALAIRLITGLRGERMAPLVPCFAITAVAAPPPAARVNALWQMALPAPLAAATLRPLLLTDNGNRAVFLPFPPDGAHPAAVLKVPKLPEFNNKTAGEQAALVALHRRLDASIAATIPRSLGVYQDGEIAVGLETYAPGRALLSSIGRWRATTRDKIVDLELATDWLVRFHRSAEIARPKWGEAERHRWLEAPFDAFRSAFGMTPDEERLLATCRRRGIALIGVPLPIVWQHNDFGPWNIYRAGRTIHVIDWEGGRPGPALCDLLYLVTHWSATARRLRGERAELRSFQALFLETRADDALAVAARTALERYMTELAIDRRFLPLLLVGTWVELALGRFDRGRTLGVLGAPARADNRPLKFLGVLAEATERLFLADSLDDRGPRRGEMGDA